MQLLLPEPQRPQTYNTPELDGIVRRKLRVIKHKYRVRCKCCRTWNVLATRARVCMAWVIRNS